ncbi:MAG: TIR domain-containing protein [Bacteroidaceae bacterium]|nr:TIR domain-containing protein [Bacteroidaceae bacterium]
MEQKKYDIFVSYSRADIDIVRKLVDDIHVKTNARCWIDWNGIESGDQFVDVIINAIDKVDTVLFILSDNSMASEFAKREIDYARNTGKKIVPVVVDGGKLRGWFLFFFGSVDYIDIKVPMQYDKLLRNIGDWYGADVKSQEPLSLSAETVGKKAAVSRQVKEDAVDTGLKKILSIPREQKGLLCLACINKKDKSIAYFTTDEWESISESIKSQYAKTGVSIYEDGHTFIIALEDCKTADGDNRFAFGGCGKDFVGVKSYNVKPSVFITGYNDTIAIIEQCNGRKDVWGIQGAPAAEAAWNYKANEYDYMQWYLPSISELMLINKYQDEINDFLSKYLPAESKVSNDWYWSSTVCSDDYAWGVCMTDGSSYGVDLLNGSILVRAVALAK